MLCLIGRLGAADPSGGCSNIGRTKHVSCRSNCTRCSIGEWHLPSGEIDVRAVAHEHRDVALKILRRIEVEGPLAGPSSTRAGAGQFVKGDAIT